MAKFIRQETSVNGADEVETVRLGSASGSANNVTSKEVGKAVKLIGESLYNLCAAGDPIEAFVVGVESYTQDGYSIGGVLDCGLKQVTFDGLQATPGTGTVAIGDYVVTGTVVAKDTALSAPVKVCKATEQPGSTAAALVNAGVQAKNAMFAWRVESLGVAASGAVGTVGIIKRVNC